MPVGDEAGNRAHSAAAAAAFPLESPALRFQEEDLLSVPTAGTPRLSRLALKATQPVYPTLLRENHLLGSKRFKVGDEIIVKGRREWGEFPWKWGF
ncbi:hypothetical protein EYF80_014766 [Liparis tanakae]|uniref:Uncharacterized protein n=1 Tax=Liparis tanakae TaxID=230148 RepID=A0A4Z2IAW7_9TELE|nr:hypothetical protein EYF80_014766 [Liparis tanakae]